MHAQYNNKNRDKVIFCLLKTNALALIQYPSFTLTAYPITTKLNESNTSHSTKQSQISLYE